jgi:hypothetical protein
VIVTKKLAAQSQLETAIWVWFERDDPISVLSLAYAANDCYAALGRHAGRPSAFRAWLKTKSKASQKRATEVQNFIKHGLKNLRGSVRLIPRLAEHLIMDAIDCHEDVFGDTTDVMELFKIRFWLENPHTLKPEQRALFTDAEAEYLKRIPRSTYCEQGLDLLRSARV